MSKVLEKVVAEQLINYIECNNLLHKHQFGFRAQHSTETAICYFLEKARQSLDQGHVMGAVFIDLRKAFDTVNHTIFLSKLSAFNFSKCSIEWFTSYLNLRDQCVKIEDKKSLFMRNKMDLPQGSILGPLLFSLFINDLPCCCPDVECQLYADDTVIYTSAKSSAKVAAVLNKQMERISIWLQENHLTSNVKKTVFMRFYNRKQKEKEIIQVNNKEIEEVDEFNFLGIVLDSQLKFDKHIKKL